jgi:hypothetical protein
MKFAYSTVTVPADWHGLKNTLVILISSVLTKVLEVDSRKSSHDENCWCDTERLASNQVNIQ